MSGGTYTLFVEVPERATIIVGALGEHTFERGWYAYTGSALGSGGFVRIERHRAVANGENDTRHWHIDYLLGHPRVVSRGSHGRPIPRSNVRLPARSPATRWRTSVPRIVHVSRIWPSIPTGSGCGGR